MKQFIGATAGISRRLALAFAALLALVVGFAALSWWGLDALRAHEAASQELVTRLHWFQVGFLVCGLALLAWAWRQVYGQVLASRQETQAWMDTLEKRVQQRTAELEALAAVSREITSHLDVAEVLKSVTEKAQQLLESEVAELCLVDVEGKQLRLHASAGPEAAVLKATSEVRAGAGGGLLEGQAARPCHTGACPGFCEILDPAYRASHIAAPVRIGERVIGALCVGNTRPDSFRADGASLLTQLAGAAAVALENSRLYDQAENAATLIERQRIASDMHDGLLQTLSFLRWMARMAADQVGQGNLEAAQTTLQQVERANAQAEEEIRRAIASLQEDYPGRGTLQDQLAAVTGETGTAGVDVTFENHVRLPIVLPRQESEQALRVAREALLNAQRYSRAKQIRVCLSKEGREILLAVHDDGLGFDPAGLSDDDRPHFGMKIMRARASRLGGALEIRSAPGRGTEVTLRWTPGRSA